VKWQLHRNSLFAILLRSPWWVSALVAAGVVGVVKLFFDVSYAVFAALPFIVIGAVAGWKQLRAPSEASIAARLERLRAMSWQEFSQAMEESYARQGWQVSRLGGGQADFELVQAWRKTLVACKRWKATRTGIEPLRELDAARRAREAQECIYVSAGEITEQALAFAAERNIRVLHGAELAKTLRGEPRIAL
jgi:restriction system protein